MLCQVRVAVVALLAVLFGPAGLAAQTGAISGQISDDRTGQPLASVQVFISDLDLGVLSEANGRYLLANVPAGTHTLTAERIGYESASQQVTVSAGETTVVNFDLGSAALALDEIIVTGTAGGTQRRAIGNVVDRVDVASQVELSPATTLVQFLGQQSPGLRMPGQQGMVGSGGAIRIRGISTLALGNQPLLYVDGVRIDNDPTTGPSIRGGRMASRINDISPEEIESIEIIKGPAAATLYGTEASNGVIQIITKSGAAGAPTMDFSVRQGANYMDSPADRFFWTYWAHDNVVDSMNIYKEREDAGDPIFTYGHLQQYNGSVRGGTDLVRYFTSVGYDDETGIVDYNWHKQLNTRANVTVTPSDTWSISANLGYTRSHTRFAQAATRFGVWEAIIWARPDTRDTPFQGFRYLTPEAAANVDSRTRNNRFIGSFQLNNNPVTWLTQRLIVGVDYSSEANQILFPRLSDTQREEWPFFGSRTNGEKTLEHGHTLYTSFDYGASASFDLTDNVTSETSVGVQYNARQRELANSVGNVFPTPAVTTISGAAVTRAGETWEENKSLGTYIQQQFGWQGRLFVTGAVRGDDHSAFGADFDAAVYPKLSATWVVSEEDFWNVEWMEQLRLRSAWGEAGAQPGAFDAVTLYSPVPGPGGQTAVTPRSLGDPGLQPEVSSEIEVGFDAALFDGRISMEVTYFDKTTKDALVSRPIRPATGFLGAQLVNLGEVSSWGTEVGLNTTVLDGERLGFDIGINFATHKNRVEDIGETTVAGGRGQRNVPGFPIRSYFGPVPTFAEFLPGTNTVNPETLLCDGGTGVGGKEVGGADVPCSEAPMLFRGQPEPEWSGSVLLGLTLFQDLRLSALTEFLGGDTWLRGDNIAGAHRSMVNTPPTNPITDPFMAAHLTRLNNQEPGNFNPGFARLRELSAVYNLPERWVSGAGAARASIALAARNVGFIWRKQRYVYDTLIFDPEMQAPGDVANIANATRIPPTSQIVATLRVTF